MSQKSFPMQDQHRKINSTRYQQCIKHVIAKKKHLEDNKEKLVNM